MKRFGVILGIFVAFLAGILLLNNPLKTASDDETSLDGEGRLDGKAQVDISADGVAESVGDLNPDNDSEQEFDSGVRENDEVSTEPRPYESQAVKYNSINSDFVMGSDHVEENFSRLAEEFRNGYDIEATEKREQFQQFFYTQNQLLSGEVSIDILECGHQLCIAELRSGDTSALRIFMDGVRDWEGFESKAIMEVPTQQPGITRLIFSHDPEINGISIPSFGS